MDPQLLMPSSVNDFNFDSTHTSPYATAPSSPKILFPNLYYSAPEDGSEDNDTDFAFDFSGQLEPSISDADELFYRGKIKPLDYHPQPKPKNYNNVKHLPQNTSSRGRQRTIATPSTTRHKVSRSVSPLRVSDILSDDHNQIKVSTTQSFPFGFMWYNKWNLKNLLLFRSTSEGSARITKVDQDGKNSSFRSNDGGGSVTGSSRRMKRKMSAHEVHYTANRAVAKEMRRKTSLPYKSGFLGCLGFGHNFHEVSSRGI